MMPNGSLSERPNGRLVRSQIDAKGGPKRLLVQDVIASFHQDASREVTGSAPLYVVVMGGLGGTHLAVGIRYLF